MHRKLEGALHQGSASVTIYKRHWKCICVSLKNDCCVSAPPLLLLPPKLIYVVESHYGVIVTGQVTVNRRIVLYGIEDSGPIELLFT